MTDFNLYSSKKSYGFYNKIFERLCCEKNDVFEKISKKDKTKFVKKIFIDLGHDSNFKVYANGFSPEEVEEISKHGNFKDDRRFVNKEWLFDIHWYTDVKADIHIPERFILACECEWAKGTKPSLRQSLIDIGYDFQKLLFCNAEERLFITRVTKIFYLKELAEYFQNAINCYRNLSRNSKFTIVCFCLEDKKIYILNLKK